MEIKYCERCGCLLGKVLKTKRYCKECAILVKRKTKQRDALHMASFRVNGAKGRCVKYTNIKSTTINARTL